jgi:hypothetical protein
VILERHRSCGENVAGDGHGTRKQQDFLHGALSFASMYGAVARAATMNDAGLRVIASAKVAFVHPENQQ